MPKFNFIGDVNELSDEQKIFITGVVEERGFKKVNIKVQPVGKAGDNYASDVKRMTVEKDGETFQMIAKVAPKQELRRTLRHVSLYFLNEHVMYTEVLPKFTELEKIANIPEKERLRYATCYGSYLEQPNEIILLEDLQIPGFNILDRFTSFTDENVRLVLKNFAKLHSLSYALKYQETETFDKFCEKLDNLWAVIADSPGMNKVLAKLDAEVQIIIDDDKYKNALENAATQMLSGTRELAKIDSNSKYSVIKQGDSWPNNIMFRLEDDRTVECCMIDYQLSTLGRPVGDLHCMIFSSTDHATRTKYFHDWIDYYHSQLNKILAKFGLKIDDVYPRYQLDGDLKLYSKVSLAHAIMLSSGLVRQREDAAKFADVLNNAGSTVSIDEMVEQTKVSKLDPVTIQMFKARLEGLVDSFIEFGYL